MSRATLENAGFVPGLSKFPEDDKIRDGEFFFKKKKKT